jgi:4-amino-4-deoxy-L-arabinose transferase-like glycosyltransferase
MTIGTLILGSAALLATAYCLAASLRLKTATEFVLAAFLIAFTEVVAVSLLLSPGRWLTQTGLLSAVYAVWLASLLAWWASGLPRPPGFGPAIAALRGALRDRVLAVLAVAVCGGLAYVAALIVGTAPNDYDVLWYHLARAAFWKQQHAVSYIAGANDYRLNAFPPNAEIADTFTMVLGRTERFAGFVQLASLGATMIAIGGIARRIGLAPRQAVFGALVFATLPVVVLQASTSLNDLVLCAFLSVAVYFLLSPDRVNLGLSALALGLALGTKANGFLALVVLALVALFVHPRRRWLEIAAFGVGAVALGSYWYLFNLAETGRLDGNFVKTAVTNNPSVAQPRSNLGPVAHLLRQLIDTVDPSGSVGRDRFVYLVVAAIVIGIGAVRMRRSRSRSRLLGVLGAAAICASLVAFRPVQHGLLHAYQKLWIELGHRRLGFFGSDKHPTHASPFQSWYGPVGFLLALAAIWLAWAAARRRRAPRVVVVLALAPLVWILLQSPTSYSPWDGRYLAFAVAVAAAVWGLALPTRPIAWAAGAACVATLGLALVHYDEKPSGVNVLGGPAPRSVWDMSRSQVLARWFHPGEESAVQTIERQAGKGSIVALAIRREDVSYPYFGSRLDRRVVFVREHGEGLADAGWLVVGPGERVTLDARWSRVATGGYGWRVYRRGVSAAS